MFRFTIRDVLWLTVVVGCLLGWSAERIRTIHLVHERDAALADFHFASQRWGEAVRLIPANPTAGRMGGGSLPIPQPEILPRGDDSETRKN